MSTCEHEKGCERKDYEQAPDNCYVYRILYTVYEQKTSHAMPCQHISDPTIMELLRVRRGATEARLTSLHFWMVVTLQRDMLGHCHQKSSTPTGKAAFFVVVESSTFLPYTTEAPPQSDDDQSGIAKRIAPPLLILRFRETLLEQKLV